VPHPVRIEHRDLGLESTVIDSTLPVWEKRGWTVVDTADNVPDRHTVEEVLAEVGDDPERAARALDAERASAKPRKSLVEGLERILNP
jgi:hypothetical protein